MKARWSSVALLALGMLFVGGCIDVPPPVPVSRKTSDDGANRLLGAQFEQARVLEVSGREAPASAARFEP